MNRTLCFASILFFGTVLSAHAGSGNEAHDIIVAMPPSQQAEALGSANCRGIEAFFMGLDPRTKLAYWSVRCTDGRSEMLEISANDRGTVKRIDCGVLAAVGGPACFKTMSPSPATDRGASAPASGNYRVIPIGQAGPFAHSLKRGDKIEFPAVMNIFHGDRKNPPLAVIGGTYGAEVRFDFDFLPAAAITKLLAACSTDETRCSGTWQATFKEVAGDVMNVFTLDGYKDVGP